MKCQEKGHVYELDNRDVQPGDKETQHLVFVNKQPGQEHAGTTTQEVLAALVDRTKHCNNCMPHPVNERILYHLRMAIALHEGRALERRVEKDGLMIEYAKFGDHGHLTLRLPENDEELAYFGDVTPNLDPAPFDGAKEPNHPKVK